ncbi:MAG: hypothetical protein ABJO27_14685 [Pseudoruegeria sp.]
MLYIVAFVAGFILSLVNGVLWNLVLFKDKYNAATLGVLRDTPIFPIGFLAITLNLIAILCVFGWIYPVGVFDPIKGILFVGLLWVPNLVNSIATTAKFRIVEIPRFIALEAGFALMNAIVIGFALSVVFSRMV